MRLKALLPFVRGRYEHVVFTLLDRAAIVAIFETGLAEATRNRQLPPGLPYIRARRLGDPVIGDRFQIIPPLQRFDWDAGFHAIFIESGAFAVEIDCTSRLQPVEGPSSFMVIVGCALLVLARMSIHPGLDAPLTVVLSLIAAIAFLRILDRRQRLAREHTDVCVAVAMLVGGRVGDAATAGAGDASLSRLGRG